MEKKKFRPNILDILLLLLIAAVALAAYAISHRQEAGPQQAITRSYTIELTNLDGTMLESVQPGDLVKDNVKNLELGVVTAVEVSATTVSSLNKETGLYQETEVPGKYTMLVTVRADTTETDKQVSTVSGFILRVGTSVSCTVGNLYASGYIVKLDR